MARKRKSGRKSRKKGKKKGRVHGVLRSDSSVVSVYKKLNGKLKKIF